MPSTTPGQGQTTGSTSAPINQSNIGSAAARGVEGQSSTPNIGLTTKPPTMKTLVYSPDVRVIIAHGLKQYDVSADIVRCSIHRAEDSAATFYMTLSNKGLRYTPVKGNGTFSRMDRIIVYMKRTKWVQVFSGYLDQVPYKQLYPGTVNFKATCTIKRLMHTWWNPALDQSNALLNQMLTDGVGGDGQLGGSNGNDNGLGGMLRNILGLVGGWKPENVHIQNFPETFFQFLQQRAKEESSVNAAALLKFKQMLLGSDTSPGVGNAAGGNPNAGLPGPQIGGASGIAVAPAGAGTLLYIQQIIAACDEKGLGPITSDNNSAAALAQAGATGQNNQNPTQQKAWQQVQQGALDSQEANRNSDGAIIGVAVAAVETGGGEAIHNWSNPACPGSESLGEGNPPWGCDLDSCGIMQQRNSGWGTVAQRMNPKQAAGMFFDSMTKKVPNWRNQDPGAVAQTVQVSAFPAKYSAAMPWATAQVKAARQATAGSASTVTGGLSTAVGSSVPVPSLGGAAAMAAPSTNPNLVVGAPSVTPSAVGALGSGLPSGASTITGIKPNPDSEGAVQFALSKCGNTPYVWGGSGPNGYDCSGLVRAAFASIGVKITGNTDGMRAGGCPQIPKSEAGRGDIYQPETGHVMILLGPPGSRLASGGGVVSASTSNAPLSQQIKVQDWYSEGFEWYGRGAMNGGPDPTSKYNPTVTGSSGGSPPGALDQTAGALGTGTSNGSQSEQIARNLFSYMFTSQFSSAVSEMWPPEKAFIDGQPLLQMVKSISSASLRKFQSAPNGDLMFYYPDWWGLDGKPAVYRMEDIELKDVRIDFSDDPLTTHVYVAGDMTQTGQVEQPSGWLDTAGVVTVEDAWIYNRLIKVGAGEPETYSGDQLLRRFGIRPLKQEYALAGSHELEILLASQVFMEKWAEQFQTNISMTFMPELYPGMRIELGGHNLSVYVTEVNHVGDREAGFTTEAVIMAPANPNALQAMASVTTGGLTNTDLERGFEFPVGGTGSVPGGGAQT